MWPWKRQVTATELPAALEKRLASVEMTLEAVQISVRKVKLEWEDVYDRIEKIVARINARSRSDRKEAETTAAEPALTSIDEINAAIRKGTFAVPQGRRQ